MADAVALGIDLGTSGVRAVAIGADRAVVAQHAVPVAPDSRRNPLALRDAVMLAVRALAGSLGGIRALAVDGTSGTILLVAPDGTPLGPFSLYNDRADAAYADAVASRMPADSAAGGATSPLARALGIASRDSTMAGVLHEADWIAGQFSGRFDVSDANNALKSGFDPREAGWPGWIALTGFDPSRLPRTVLAPGTPIGPVRSGLGLPASAIVAAGTTDGCASFLATGARETGEGVSALGSTLTVKLLCDRPIFAPQYGIYSHLLLGRWLAGGASNTGGAALAKHFAPEQIKALSARIDPDRPTGLDYYPLPGRGERFPLNDPALEARETPRPDDDARFLQGLLEGIAAVEARGYARLRELGGPPVLRVLTVGGGAANAPWTVIRAHALGCEVTAATQSEAAYGTALLALHSIEAS